MRFFRITLNPQDPYVLAGPGGNSVTLRLPLRFTGQMFYSTFSDGAWVRVPDQEMGEVGEILDVVNLGLEPPLLPYKMFQEGGLPQGAVEADIPLWSAQAVPLWQPGDPEPEPQPTVWAALNVQAGPE